MSFLNAISMSRRLWLMTGASLIGLVIMATSVLLEEATIVRTERQRAVQQTVEIAHGLIAHHHELVTKGALPEKEGKERALAAIKSLRYSGTEYFWVNDMSGIMVMHAANPKLDGTDVNALKDSSGKQIFPTFIQVVKEKGQGTVAYDWPKPGSDTPQPKVSFVKGFAPWGWIVGSGVYVDDVNTIIRQQIIYLGAGVLAMGIVLLVVGRLIARSLLLQVGGEPTYAAQVTDQIAAGDLTVHVQTHTHNNDSLLHSLQLMRDKLASLVSQVRRSADQVANASAEIASGNMDLTARTESQAAALEETVSSMEHLNSAIKQSADSARQANQMAQSAASVATRGGEVVNQVVETMKGIEESSRRISDIIGVIDGIAFQTNILALNAAVEAARAGEAGRGFAVVASEVRSLAQRSAGAAKEIKSLIDDSVSRVSRGTTLVGDAGSTMTEVVDSIHRVTQIVSEISTTSSEQQLGVSQVVEAIGHIDQVTQQNAALVEEMAASAAALNNMANELVTEVNAFKLAHQS
ncbi:MAG TPA: methyl-accepting chemotaxis protein [Burkholderiaceae bacterium]|nr:methyl-accepting chemotaxis protein [Burkholderiaceae bacterium]